MIPIFKICALDTNLSTSITSNLLNIFMLVLFVILTIYKLLEYHQTYKISKSMCEISSLKSYLKETELKLNRFLSLYLFMSIFACSWIGLSLGNGIYEIFTTALNCKNYNLLVYLSDIKRTAEAGFFTSWIVLLYGLGWIVFNRLKVNLMRSLKIKICELD